MQKSQLYTLAFLEGIAVMAIELLGAKMLTPFYSSSLQVWTLVLGITLFSLTVGYYTGGKFSEKINAEKIMFLMFFFSSIMASFISKFANNIFISTIELNYLTGAVISSFIILFPPLFFLGNISPLLIKTGAKNLNYSGKTAGTVYGISTFGGIFATFITGFLLIPLLGTLLPFIFISLILAIPPVLYFAKIKKYYFLLMFIPVMLLVIPISKDKKKSLLKVVYQSNGILGEIKVYDHPGFENKKKIDRRILLLNNIAHTGIDQITKSSLFDYCHLISILASNFASGNNALVIGMAGGSVLDELNQLGFNVDAVEIEPRMQKIAKTYFYPNLKMNVFIDDGRHFLNTTTKKYNLVIFDAYIGESPPAHLITLESLIQLKNNLTPEAKVFINSNNFIENKEGNANRSLIKTFNQAGYELRAFIPERSNAGNNIILVASIYPFSQGINSTVKQNPCCIAANISLRYSEIDISKLNREEDYILKDNYPILDVLMYPVTHDTRQSSIDFFQHLFKNESIPLIN